jgi:PAS domain S-box-containing protein
MEQNNSHKIITQIILGQSTRSVRLITILFVACSALLKLLFDKYLPDIIDLDVARWALIVVGTLFFLSTYIYQSSAVYSYFTLFLYLLTLFYVVYLALINNFDPSATTILILVMGAGTVIINSLYFYRIQAGIIVFASVMVFYNNTLSDENTIAFFNLIVAISVFGAVTALQQRLRSNVGLSQSLLQKLEVLSIMANKKGEIVFVSPTVKTLLGYERKELLKEGWWKIRNISEAWISRDHILNYPNIIPKEIVALESRVVTKSGKVVWLNWVNSVLPNGNYMGIALDITKYKEK